MLISRGRIGRRRAAQGDHAPRQWRPKTQNAA